MSVVVIVGGDSGIGAALATLYDQRGDTVYASCLTDGALWAGSTVTAIPMVDVTDDNCITQLRAALDGVAINTVAHVAGVGRTDRWGAFDFELMRTDYNLNALGPLRSAAALAGNMSGGGRWGIVTSRMGSIGDNGSGRMYSYRMSKAAANMLGVNLYHQFKPLGVAVMLLHPGTVATPMTRGARNWDAFTKPEDAAAGLIRQLDDLDADTPPQFRHADGTLLPW